VALCDTQPVSDDINHVGHSTMPDVQLLEWRAHE